MSTELAYGQYTHTEQDVLNKVQLLIAEKDSTGWYVNNNHNTACFVANGPFNVNGVTDDTFRIEIFPIYCKEAPVIIYKEHIYYESEIWKNTADPDRLVRLVDNLIGQVANKPKTV